MSDNPEYELMCVIKEEISDKYPNGIDSDSVALGNALGVIRYLLKHDETVKGWKLVKKQKKAQAEQGAGE